MTASELAKYFSNLEAFTDPDQEVRFVLTPDGVPFEKGTRLEMRGSNVPEPGKAVVAFRPAPTRKYMFSLKFEANPVIEAQTLEEAEKEAFEMMRNRIVRSVSDNLDDDSYEAQEPCFLEEVEG